MIETADAYEYIQFVAATVGSALNGGMMLPTWLDFVWSRRKKHLVSLGGRRIALRRFRSHLGKTVIQIVFLVVGLYAITQPPPGAAEAVVESPAFHNTFGWLLELGIDHDALLRALPAQSTARSLGMVFASVILVLMALWDVLDFWYSGKESYDVRTAKGEIERRTDSGAYDLGRSSSRAN
jgi:hypothetical protein